MSSVDRGVIRNREYASQLRNYRGLRYGTITPTDIDGLIEYKDAGFIWMETKFKDSALPRGQELALERVVLSQNRPAFAVVTSHDTDGDIDMANTQVVRYFRNLDRPAHWKTPPRPMTLAEIVTIFTRYLDRCIADIALSRNT